MFLHSLHNYNVKQCISIDLLCLIFSSIAENLTVAGKVRLFPSPHFLNILEKIFFFSRKHINEFMFLLFPPFFSTLFLFPLYLCIDWAKSMISEMHFRHRWISERDFLSSGKWGHILRNQHKCVKAAS